MELSNRIQLRLAGDGRLWLEKKDARKSVTITRCFPWTEPLNWLSLRTEEGDEVELVENLDDLESESRQALLGAMAEAAFVLRIESIDSIEEDIELRNWSVRLKEGNRRFQTKLNAWPRELPSGGLLIQDVANDLYLIPDLERLDARSSKLLFAFLDD